MSLIDVIKSPKEWLIQVVATKLLKKSADGGYGKLLKDVYWFLHDYAPQIAIVIDGIQVVLKHLYDSGSCPSCLGFSDQLVAVINFLGAIGLVFSVHAVEGPVNPKPGPVALPAVETQREIR